MELAATVFARIQQPRRFRSRYTLTFARVTHTPPKASDNTDVLGEHSYRDRLASS